MKRKGVLRKITLVLGIAASAVLMTGCQDSRERTEKTQVQERQSEAQSAENEVQETESNVLETDNAAEPASFGDVGNDPNNIHQSWLTPAFDEKHIYFSTFHEMMQANLDGTEIKMIGDENGHYLNVYNGYLYYYSGRSSKMRIKRINLSTYQEETIYEVVAEGVYSAPEIISMLAVNGHLFFALEDSNRGCTSIESCDLETLQFTRRYYDSSKALHTVLTVSEDAMYALIEDGESMRSYQVFKLSFDDFSNGGEFRMVADSSYYSYIKSVIFTPDGLYRLSPQSTWEEDMHYYKASYSKINEEELRWGFVSEEGALGTDIFKLFETDEKTANWIYSGADRYLTGDAMVLFMPSDEENGEPEVCRFENFDFENKEVIGTISSQTYIYGAYEDTLYMVEVPENYPEEGEIKIYRAEADGTWLE